MREKDRKQKKITEGDFQHFKKYLFYELYMKMTHISVFLGNTMVYQIRTQTMFRTHEGKLVF